MKRFLFVISLLGLALFANRVHATTVKMTFDKLPSAQGWEYFNSVFVPPSPETQVYAVDGKKLAINSMGCECAGLSGSYRLCTDPAYRMYDVIDETQPYVITVRARVIQNKRPYPPYGEATGFGFGAFAGNQTVFVTLNTNVLRIGGDDGSRWNFDGTKFHDFRLEVIPDEGYTLYIDGNKFTSGRLFSEPGLNHLALGNNTGYEPINAEVTQFEFTQSALPPPIKILGSASAGIELPWEAPRCWFSPIAYNAESPSSIGIRDMKYNSFGQLIEYSADGTGNGHPIKTHVYSIIYNALGQSRSYVEDRTFPESGKTYRITIYAIVYDSLGRVTNFSYKLSVLAG